MHAASAPFDVGPSLRSPLRENRVSAGQRKRPIISVNLI
jgi:hypothetical protein